MGQVEVQLERLFIESDGVDVMGPDISQLPEYRVQRHDNIVNGGNADVCGSNGRVTDWIVRVP